MNHKNLHLTFAVISGIFTVVSILAGNPLIAGLNAALTYFNYTNYKRLA